MNDVKRQARRVYLVGPRASGKTTVGKALAARAGWHFEDTDATLTATAGMTVEQIVEREGWEGFRRRETEALCATLGRDGLVVATGGGMVLAEENRRMLRDGGLVAYLCGSVDLLAGRLARDPLAAQRPSLTGRPIAEEVAEVLAAREPLYRECAHVALDAGDDLRALVERLASLLEG
ncbi:shikimate kinase AroL [Nitratidesulfovibrio sp. SRB-5]|uniref:shikimate kinase AroL n=1 Tax=Nitratidesulfovibrio sp. SRB-5 TaxID=2872636 RepID=UPI001027C4B5|nr:shikimate kinase AroL [Nitratidesulfovibrio sp. SRB-5]MBZ2172434.1 shikimate kinase AroL [Nitratidesulfovibrio sp. SRB-5]RXF76594.1 shikimate kinase AroL [Desulfovibrio sp. DS-1]